MNRGYKLRLKDFDLTEQIYIDANVFLYNAIDDENYGEICTLFLEKVERAEVSGVVAPLVIEEVIFKILCAEASKYIEDFSISKLRKKLKERKFSSIVYKPVQEYMEYLEAIFLGGLRIIKIDISNISDAVKLAQEFGLITADAIHLACMKANSIKNIATKDSDFKADKLIKVWEP